MMERIKSIYHYLWAIGSACYYLFPSRKIFVIGITGTKGKTTTAEILSAILEAAGEKTALSSTLRFKSGTRSERNLKKMTMPGRHFLQRFLYKAVKEKSSYAVIEMTSEGAKQFRHKFIYMNALIFTNLSPEHIESHGSYEKYRQAKLAIVEELNHSPKRPRTIVVNNDDTEAGQFLAAAKVEKKLTYGLKNNFPYKTRLPGDFNRLNILAAAALTKSIGLDDKIISKAVEEFKGVRGRMEKIDNNLGVEIYVDYAHTPDSLEKAYKALEEKSKVCVLGSAGGGRDKWKRPEMGAIASRHCRKIILTDEDPYDEDPRVIVRDIASGIKRGDFSVIMDRREAIREAINEARRGEVIMVTGKGTDPYIMGAEGSKIPWDDAEVIREELKKYAGTA